MQRIWARELAAHAGERVRLAGWVHRQRRLGRIGFLVVRDATGLAQVVVDEPDSAPELAAESVVEIEGEATAAPQAPGGVEVHDPRIRVLAEAESPPPLELYRPVLKEQLATILDHAPVSLRHPRRQALFRIAAASVAGFRARLDALGFVEVQTSKIVGFATEGGANVFPVDYFGRKAFLAQSPQLYKQIMVGVFERVYEAGSVFRAEPHDTARHLSEYVSLDAELGFVRDHTTVMGIVREAVDGMAEAIRERAAEAIEPAGVELPEVPAQIPAIDFSEAQRLIEEATGEELAGELDLAPAHERWLGDWARREHGSGFLFVTGFPMAKRPFYTHPDPARPDTSNSFDLLFRGLEIVTGGQRLHRYEDYVAALAERGESPEPYEGYLEAFRYGMPPHGGFALGLARWLARLAGITNIRESTLFPRDLKRLSP
jgi:nondiscriminating aspartyl-tRNA synthetase